MSKIQKTSHTIQRAHPRTTLGPISLLPTEVLSNIFLCCALSEDCKYIGDRRAAPLVLTQVCSSWRKVCLRIPQLWSNLNLTLTTTSPELPRASPFSSRSSRSSSSSSSSSASSQALANLTSLWIERARNQLLSVSVKLSAPHSTTSNNTSNDISSFCDPILSNAHSIQRLSIDVTCASQLRKFFTSSDVNFTKLQSLSLTIQHVEFATPITVFNNSPRLTRVSFKLNDCPPSTSLLHLPWANIEQFEMAGASLLPADSFQSLLASCTNLRKASFWVEDAYHHPTIDLSSSLVISNDDAKSLITLPNLSHLSISFYGRHAKTANSLLAPFNLPHLRHFHFFSGFITLPFLPAITSTSPHSHLQSLVTSGVNVSAAEFSHFAARHSSLCSLTLDLRYFTPDDVSSILDVLATERPRALLPALSTLSLWTQDISPHTSGYLRMIQSRGKKGSTSGNLHFSLYLARQQHGACCHFATCATSVSKKRNSATSLDAILTLADACEKTDGVIFYLKDVNPGDGIKEIA